MAKIKKPYVGNGVQVAVIEKAKIVKFEPQLPPLPEPFGLIRMQHGSFQGHQAIHLSQGADTVIFIEDYKFSGPPPEPNQSELPSRRMLVELDKMIFINCQFYNVQFYYEGGPFRLGEGNIYSNVDIGFGGHSNEHLDVMRDLVSALKPYMNRN